MPGTPPQNPPQGPQFQRVSGWAGEGVFVEGRPSGSGNTGSGVVLVRGYTRQYSQGREQLLRRYA
jgi:hypothetical protein